MNTNTNTHRVYEATITMDDGEVLTKNVAVAILDAEASGIGSKAFAREQLKRSTRGNVKSVRVGKGHETVGVPAGATELRVSSRAITTNKRAKENWLAGRADFVASKVAERANA